MRGSAAVLAALLGLGPAPAAAADGRVRAVLFVSPTCPHCQRVQSGVLPALAERFGSGLQIAILSTSTRSGHALFRETCRRYGVARPGVPLLLVDDRVLIGSRDIPARFPALVETLLEDGGSAWPDLPGLSTLVVDTPSPAPAAPLPATAAAARADAVPAAVPTPLRLPDEGPTGVLERVAMDPAGNALALALLAVMVGVVARSAILVTRGPHARWAPPAGWRVPILTLLGLGIASYLSWVEVGDVEAVCGPVGDCNTVQQSEYATLFGVVPVGVLGLLGFAATLAVWWLGRLAAGRTRRAAGITLVLLTACGTLFSIYLTFLEPFVIGATCAWCLASAATMTLLYWIALEPCRIRPFLAPRHLTRAHAPARGDT